MVVCHDDYMIMKLEDWILIAGWRSGTIRGAFLVFKRKVIQVLMACGIVSDNLNIQIVDI